jgi:glycerol uptake facilitator-like aquaporin
MRHDRAAWHKTLVTSLLRRSVTEAFGSAFLLAGIVGSGIMAERLSNGNTSLALLANTLATAGILMCLIAALAPISGAYFNPAVSIADAIRGVLPWSELPAYVGAQLSGAIAGVVAANTMFGLPMLFASHHIRGGARGSSRARSIRSPLRP